MAGVHGACGGAPAAPADPPEAARRQGSSRSAGQRATHGRGCAQREPSTTWSEPGFDDVAKSRKKEWLRLCGLNRVSVPTRVARHRHLQLGRIKQDSRVKSLQENVKFLEQRLSAMLSEKEEQAIKLKSEVIVYKQKAKQYKEQMLEQKKHYETKSEQILADQVGKAKMEYVDEMRSVQDENQRLKGELARLSEENKELAERNKEFEKESVDPNAHWML